MIEDFESTQTSWTFAGADGSYRIVRHQRSTAEAHWGQSSEALTLAGGYGTYLYFSHAIPNSSVHDDLTAGVWVKADRPGIQLLVRVVFPHAKDPRTGEPVTTLLRGASYRQPGTWEKLTIDNVAQHVTRQARVLRLQLKDTVEERGAFIDMVLLNAYGGQGTTNLLIDDLEIEGHLPSGGAPARSAPQLLAASHNLPNNSHVAEASPQPVRMQGSIIYVGGRPFFPRAVEYHGEPLDYLKKLGFNTILLPETATPWQLQQARRFDLWLICPPPDVRSGRGIGPMYDRVLAWMLGNQLTEHQLPAMRELCTLIRRSDEWITRPIVCQAETDLRAYSRVANVLVLDKAPLGTTMELAFYSPWLQGRRQLARPGTPVWATIQTQPAQELLQQIQAIGGPAAAEATAEPDQIRLLAYAAAAAGVRGMIFSSRSRLDENDAATRQRAQALQLLNVELELIEPWLSAGSGVSSVRLSHPHCHADIISDRRSQLILATHLAPGSQYVVNTPPEAPFSFVVPGVPESSEAYLVSPTSLRPLRSRRVTGGMRVTLDATPLAAAVVFTNDPMVYGRLVRMTADTRMTTARLQHSIAQLQWEGTNSVHQQLVRQGGSISQSRSMLSLAEAALGQGQRLIGAGDAAGGSAQAAQASRLIGQLRRAHWEQAVTREGLPAIRPWSAAFTGLPLRAEANQYALADDSRRGRLRAGGMENLEELLDTGWRHHLRDCPLVKSHVELSPHAHAGRFALRLSTTHEGETDATCIESPPVWINSAPVEIRRGQWLRVQGWVHVPENLRGSYDGLMIYDSLGGQPLALRIGRTSGWQQFRFFRRAPADGQLQVTVAMTGLGEAFIDDMDVVLLSPPTSYRSEPYRSEPYRSEPPPAAARRLPPPR